MIAEWSSDVTFHISLMALDWSNFSFHFYRPVLDYLSPSKIETVMANLTQIVPSKNINAHMQTL